MKITEENIENIKIRCEQLKPLLIIKCITYNHEPYIRDTLEGFVMQKTDFPFVAVVHDDASTDGTVEIIRKYVERYPDIILPIYEEENQYSKRDGSLTRIMDDAIKSTGAKYVAICEGDDYWIDPLKLQKQVDFMESHPEYSMSVTNYWFWDCRSGEQILRLEENDRDIEMEELIMKSDRCCATASMLMRSELYKNRGDKTKGIYVGDYPLCIYMRYQGRVRLLGKDITCVYRYHSLGSWTATTSKSYKTLSGLREGFEKEKQMLRRLDKMTDNKWHSIFKQREHLYLFSRYLRNHPTRAAIVFWKNPHFFLTRYSKKTVIAIHGYRQIKFITSKIIKCVKRLT